MKYKILITILTVAIISACNSEGHNHDEHEGHNHDEHEGHNHDEHEGHNHDEHEGHNHDEHEGHNHDEHEGHDSHETVMIQYSAFTEEYELFAEADAFVAGHTAKLISYFTRLSDFKALQSGKVTLVLSVNGTETRQIATAPVRKGIYRFDILPQHAGTGTLRFEIESDTGTQSITLSDIAVHEHSSVSKESGMGTSPKTGTVVFTKEQSWKIDFATAPAVRTTFGQTIKTTAQILPSQGDEVIVAGKTNGTIVFSKIPFVEGSSVTAGQTLLTISADGLAENSTSVKLNEAKNNLTKAKSEYERAKLLAQDKYVSEKDLIDSKNKFENAALLYNNMSRNFSPEGQTVTSPVAGFAKQIFVKNGQYVEAGQPIAIISQNKSLTLVADVPTRYAPILGLIHSANIRSVYDNKTYSLQQLNGKVLSYGKSANADNHLIPVSLQIDNTGSFVAGGFAEIFLITRTNTQALTIPNSALLEEQGNFSVYVQIAPELYEKREVRIGATDGLVSEIMTGISVNERIVTRGAIFIKLAQATSTLDAHSGHVH